MYCTYKKDDIKYKVIEKGKVEVIYVDSLASTISIPETVSFNEQTYSVTSIGENACYSCSALTSITIPNSVTRIGNSAFNGCYSLTSITIPNSVTSIGEEAFYGCSALTSITIPNSVTSIGYSAFSGCSALTSITIPNSVTSIGSYAFSGCTALTKTNYTGDIAGWCAIQFDNYISNPIYYSRNLYINDVEIKDLVIPNSVTSIGNSAFDGCSSLTSITIPNSVTSIGHSAFNACSALTSITIPNSVTSIGYSAFNGCSALTSITIPNSVTSIENHAFSYCSSLTSITIPNSVTNIGSYAFKDCSSLTSITIPNSVTRIAEYAFSGCSRLTSVISMSCTPPERVLGDVFNDTPWEKTLVVPNSSVNEYRHHYPWSLFLYIERMYALNIQSSDARLGTAQIDQDVDCDSVAIISATANDGYYFVQWTDGNTDNSRTIQWSKDTTLTAEFGLAYSDKCSGMCGDNLYWEYKDKELTITGNGAMYNYTKTTMPWLYLRDSIYSITLPQGITSIGEYAFSGCHALSSITLPNSLTGKIESLNPNAVYFVNMTGWSDIHVYAWIDKEGSVSENASWPGEIATKADFTYQGYDVYYFTASPGDYAYCIFNNGGAGTGDKTEDLTWTGGQAYFNNKWNTIQIDPYYDVAVGTGAFNGCSSLRNITCHAVTPPTCGSNAFNGVPYDATLCCPCESKKAYQAAEGWSRFNDIRCMNSTQITLLTDTEKGSVQIDEWISEPYSVVISATPNVGYAFTRWSDGNTDNPRTVLLTQDTTLTAEFGLTYSGKCGENLYWAYKNKALTITGSGAMYNYTKTTMPWLYLRDSIYSITLPQGITSIGEYAFSGCHGFSSITIPNSIEGKHVNTINLNAVYFANTENWSDIYVYAWNDMNGSVSNNKSWPGEIATKADFTYQGYDVYYYASTSGNYQYCIFNNGKGGTGNQTADLAWTGGQIYCNGEWHTVQTASDNETAIGAGAFNGCSSLRNIRCLAVTPPTCASNAFNDVPYDATLWCPCASLDAYEMDAVLGSFKHIECIGSEDADITDKTVTVVPGNVDATFTWPITDGAETYTLVITKDGVTFCTLVFNKQGQLVSIAFKPARQNAPATEGTTPANYAEQTANGFRFTVTNLSEGTVYAYTLTVRDAANSILETYTGEFTTQSDMPMGIEASSDNTPAGQSEKLLRDGQVLIIRNGETYDMMGQRLQ
ncbi:MAG: leucine-rich repeat protein [Paludibacteraceae bacterium]